MPSVATLSVIAARTGQFHAMHSCLSAASAVGSGQASQQHRLRYLEIPRASLCALIPGESGFHRISISRGIRARVLRAASGPWHLRVSKPPETKPLRSASHRSPGDLDAPSFIYRGHGGKAVKVLIRAARRADGNDFMHGGGNDTFRGDDGADALRGGDGTGVSRRGTGNDVLFDGAAVFVFDVNPDKINLSKRSGLNNFSQVQAAMFDFGGGTVTGSGGHSLQLIDATVAGLDANGFVFGSASGPQRRPAPSRAGFFAVCDQPTACRPCGAGLSPAFTE